MTNRLEVSAVSKKTSCIDLEIVRTEVVSEFGDTVKVTEGGAR